MGLSIKLIIAILWIFLTWLGYIKNISILGLSKETIAAFMAAFTFLIVLLPNQFLKKKTASSSHQGQRIKKINSSNVNQIGGDNSGNILNKKEN